jgi:hypothetical protein
MSLNFQPQIDPRTDNYGCEPDEAVDSSLPLLAFEIFSRNLRVR